jgi:hypothetical protein
MNASERGIEGGAESRLVDPCALASVCRNLRIASRFRASFFLCPSVRFRESRAGATDP